VDVWYCVTQWHANAVRGVAVNQKPTVECNRTVNPNPKQEETAEGGLALQGGAFEDVPDSEASVRAVVEVVGVESWCSGSDQDGVGLDAEAKRAGLPRTVMGLGLTVPDDLEGSATAQGESATEAASSTSPARETGRPDEGLDEGHGEAPEVPEGSGRSEEEPRMQHLLSLGAPEVPEGAQVEVPPRGREVPAQGEAASAGGSDGAVGDARETTLETDPTPPPRQASEGSHSADWRHPRRSPHEEEGEQGASLVPASPVDDEKMRRALIELGRTCVHRGQRREPPLEGASDKALLVQGVNAGQLQRWVQGRHERHAPR